MLNNFWHAVNCYPENFSFRQHLDIFNPTRQEWTMMNPSVQRHQQSPGILQQRHHQTRIPCASVVTLSSRGCWPRSLSLQAVMVTQSVRWPGTEHPMVTSLPSITWASPVSTEYTGARARNGRKRKIRKKNECKIRVREWKISDVTMS